MNTGSRRSMRRMPEHTLRLEIVVTLYLVLSVRGL